MKTIIYSLLAAAFIAGCSSVTETNNFEKHGDLDGNALYREAYNIAAEWCDNCGQSFDRCMDEQHGCFIKFAYEVNSLSKKYGEADVDRKFNQTTTAMAWFTGQPVSWCVARDDALAITWP